MTGRYVERDHDPLKAAADQVSMRIANVMNGAAANSVTLKGARN